MLRCRLAALLAAVCVSFLPFVHAESPMRYAAGKSMKSDRADSSADRALPESAVPRLVKFTGHLPAHPERPISTTRNVTFALYAQQSGGEPLWSETQWVNADATGQYTVMLGSAVLDGMPIDAFSTGQARWLGVTVEGEAEQPRMLLVSVPYALKAEEAEKLGGKVADEFATKSDVQATVQQSVAQAIAQSTLQSQANTAGGAQGGGLDDSRSSNNALAKVQPSVTQQGVTGAGATSFSDTSGNEVVYVNQSGTGMGVNAASTGTVAVNGTNSSGTGIAVRGSATSQTGTAVGVRGDTAGTNGQGVAGFASSVSGTATGVQGQSSGDQGTGVNGTAAGMAGVGVHGIASSPSGKTVGVLGETVSPTGTAGMFNVTQPGATILSGQLNGQQQFSVDSSGNITAAGNLTIAGSLNVPNFVPSFSGSNATQVVNIVQSGTGTALVLNNSNAAGGSLLTGLSNGQQVFNLSGSSSPQYTVTVTNNTPGIINPSISNPPPAAILAHSTTNVNQAAALIGIADGTDSVGVVGVASATSASVNNSATGVLGTTQSPNGKGVQGEATATTGNTRGILARVASPTGVALEAQSLDPGGLLLQGTSGPSGQQQQVFKLDAAGNLGTIGTVSAQHFVGDGSGLTGIPGFNGVLNVNNATQGLLVSQSGPGAALALSETGGGSLLTGTVNGQQLFGVDHTGNVSAYSFTATGVQAGILSHDTNTDGTQPGAAIVAQEDAPNGAGMQAISTATTGKGSGLSAIAFGDNAAAVFADARDKTGAHVSNGVHARAQSTNAVGIFSETTNTSGLGVAVQGQSNSTQNAIGVFGQSLAATGPGIGVLGQTNSPTGIAGEFQASQNGQILAGLNGTTQVFSVDGTGTVSATKFIGDGTALSFNNLNANAGSVAGNLSVGNQLSVGQYATISNGDANLSSVTAVDGSFVVESVSGYIAINAPAAGPPPISAAVGGSTRFAVQNDGTTLVTGPAVGSAAESTLFVQDTSAPTGNGSAALSAQTAGDRATAITAISQDSCNNSGCPDTGGVGVYAASSSYYGAAFEATTTGTASTAVDVLATGGQSIGVSSIANAPSADGANTTIGVYAEVDANEGTAAIVKNAGGGKILSAQNGSSEVASIGGDGTITAQHFVGDGSGLTGVTAVATTTDANTLQGHPASDFALQFGDVYFGNVQASGLIATSANLNNVSAGTLSSNSGEFINLLHGNTVFAGPSSQVGNFSPNNGIALLPTTTATAGGAGPSSPVDILSTDFNSASGGVENNTFRWQANVNANNTPAPVPVLTLQASANSGPLNQVLSVDAVGNVVAGKVVQGSTGIRVGTDSALGAAPRMTWTSTMPNSNLGTIGFLVPDRAIVVTRITVGFLNNVMATNCATPLVFTLSGGTNSQGTPGTVTVTIPNGSSDIADSGALGSYYIPAGATTKVQVTQVESCAGMQGPIGSNFNVTVQYRMQGPDDPSFTY